MKPIILALTGASGAVYGLRLLDLLLEADAEVRLVFSPAAFSVAKEELGVEENGNESPERFLAECRAACNRLYFPGFVAQKTGPGRFVLHVADDFTAPVASGSFSAAGMIVAPCSCGTLGCIASGVHRHLVHRAADVQLKERRRLVLLVRESPLSLIHLQNMERITQAGGIVQPACPHFYSGGGASLTSGDLVDSVLSRTLDLFGIAHSIGSRWKES